MKYIFFLCWFMISATVVGQEITAHLGYSFSDSNKLIVQISLKNNSTKSLYFLCEMHDLCFDDYLPITSNTGSPYTEFESRRDKLSDFLHKKEKPGLVKDTIRLILPVTKERYQKNSFGNKKDIFEILDNLRSIYSMMDEDTVYRVPLPVNSDTVLKESFFDKDLYRLLLKHKMLSDLRMFNKINEVITLNPNETKEFSIDLSYLMLEKGTYQIKFDCSTKISLIKKDRIVLRKLGYNLYKGKIISNTIYIVSPAGAFYGENQIKL